MRTNGIEPSRPHGHGLLRPARLPVPPRPHTANLENTNSCREIQIAGVSASRKCGNGPPFWYICQVDTDLAKNLAAVRLRIGAAAARAGRGVDEIKLVAVSKTHPAASIAEAIEAGITIFGENKVQEAAEKIPHVGRNAAEWHLIGHLQSNKVRRAVKLFDVIESVDSIELAERLERICIEEGRDLLSVFIQVDLAGEEAKSGASEKEIPDIVELIRRCSRLKLDGLMTVPPYFEVVEKVRPFFHRLRAIRDEILPGGGLSMGMSHDFETAIEEGATVVRVGTAIFGERVYSNG